MKKAATKKSTPASGIPKADLAWFTNDRLGMFIHWGLYALPARHEWFKRHARLTTEEYKKYFDHFDPDLYDPTEWARMAKAAGMKYFVITTKHHEGFCLWDTQYTDYKATNTPYGKDVLRMVVDAFRAEGIKVGFYYSLLDWHHPDFPVDKHHPQSQNQEFCNEQKHRDVRKYAKYMHNQVRELLTNYGKIDVLWFDFSYPGKDGKGHEDWQSEKLIKMVRELQPGIVVNNRLDLPKEHGDYETPEQHMLEECPTDAEGNKLLWETCQTFSGSWGYHRDEATWKSPKQLLYLLIDTVSKGGNLLLNVGPTARGTFDYRAKDSLAAMADWMKLHSRSIYGCTEAPDEILTPRDTRLTWNPKTRRLYVHFLNWPIREFQLPGLAGKLKYAQLLNDASEVPFVESSEGEHVGLNASVRPDAVKLQLPVTKPVGVEVPVVELFMQ